jgi:hypothetical protein
MEWTALCAGAFVIVRRPHVSALLVAFITTALVASLRGRSRGRSALICGLGAGAAATVTFEEIEVAYDHNALGQLLNVAGTALGWAIIGGFFGRTVWLVGRRTVWLAKRGR